MSRAVTGVPTLAPGCAFSETERAVVAAGNAGASFTASTVTVTEPSSLREPSDSR